MAEASATTANFSEDLSSELEALASIFASEGEFDAQELPANGEYICIVQVKPKGLPVGLEFSLPETYPESSPKVDILPRVGDAAFLNDDSLLTELLPLLYQSAQETVGEPVMYSLVDVAKEWLEGRSISKDHDEEDAEEGEEEVEEEDEGTQLDCRRALQTGAKKKKQANLQDDEEDDYQRKGKKEKKKKKQLDEDLGPGKKPRMKTASEVISRIQWDSQLSQEDFIVGYLDRFVGIVEKPFTAFSWVDIATVDDYVTLAIPRHRIQYFKYKDEVVWDKNERLDNVFGSTGSKKTILDTVKTFSKENQSVEEKEASDVAQEMTEDVTEGPSSETGATPQEHRKQRPSHAPNYFFAVRITDPVILRCVRRIQEAVCEEDPRLEEACSDPRRLHITLCTMRLDNQDDMTRAIGVLQSLQGEISALLSPVTMLRFQGLGQFNNRVLYSPPEEVPALLKLSQTLQMGLADAGINLAGNYRKFNPHMTLMKMGWSETAAFDGRPVHFDLYKRFSEAFIGVQPIDAIHLCSMEDPRRADGFYHCLASMDVQSEH